MIHIRKSDMRGKFRNHWLDARFTFSFGNYRDPDFDGYSDLWVLNDDRVAPGGGFAEHSHEDVEVMSYPLTGAIEHRDSLGNVAIMRPGDIHLMRAGTGIRHSEMNASASDPEHHLQWWIRPAQRGLKPDYARIHVPPDEKRNTLRLIASPDGNAGSLAIAQDVRVFVSLIDGATVTYHPPAHRKTFLHVVAGRVTVNGHSLSADDGAFVEIETVLELRGAPGTPGEVLLFDLRGDADPASSARR